MLFQQLYERIGLFWLRDLSEYFYHAFLWTVLDWFQDLLLFRSLTVGTEIDYLEGREV